MCAHDSLGGGRTDSWTVTLYPSIALRGKPRWVSGCVWWRHRCGCCLSFSLVAAGWQGPLADFGAGRPRDGRGVGLHPLPYQVPPLCCLTQLPLVLRRRVPPPLVRLVRRRAQVALIAAAVVAWDACGCRRVLIGLQPGCIGLQAALAVQQAWSPVVSTPLASSPSNITAPMPLSPPRHR